MALPKLVAHFGKTRFIERVRASKREILRILVYNPLYVFVPSFEDIPLGAALWRRHHKSGYSEHIVRYIVPEGVVTWVSQALELVVECPPFSDQLESGI